MASTVGYRLLVPEPTAAVSRIYFHAKEDEAEVLGSERAHCGVMCSDLLWLSLGIRYESAPGVRRLLAMFPESHYLRTIPFKPDAPILRMVETAVCTDSNLMVDGERVDTFTLALNTACRLGDPMRLLARVHGQCEIHGWVEGRNRNWLASRIEEARKANLLRAGMGWESVVDLLRAWTSTAKRSFMDDAVVTSYSVCEPFPNAGICKDAGLWTPGADHCGINDADDEYAPGEPWWDGDEWLDLSADEQWSMGVAALPSRAPEWSPATWGTLFGSGMTGWDLSELLNRVEVPS